MEISQSIEYVNARGSNLEKERLNSILYRQTPSHDAMQALAGLQNEDGGFPFGMKKGNLSTVNETTVALWWLEELDQFSSSIAQGAFTYLINTQKSDGSWDEDPRIGQYDLPPWIQIGDARTRMYLSGYASYWLAAGGYFRIPHFRKALHFLIRSQDQSGKFYGYLHTTWIATGALLLAGDRYSSLANLGLQFLESKLITSWADSQIAWALDCLSNGGLPASHPLVDQGLRELITRQNLDGSWASEDGEAAAVGATIQALKVLLRYGIISAS